MKKVFLYLLLIVLLGCRNEDVWVENIKYEEESRKFSVFTAQSPNDTIDYAKGFEILAKRYDSLYQENFTRNLVLDTLGKKKILGYINFNIRTKVFTNEEGDKWVVFPKIGQNKVINLYLALLQNNEREVYFYDIDNQSDFYKDHIEKFQMSYERFIFRKKSLLWKLKTFGKVEDEDGHEYIEAEPIPEKEIEEVVIVSPRFKGGGSNGVVVSFPNIVFPIFGGGCIVFDGCRGGGRNGGEHSSEPKKFNPDEEEVEDDLDPCGKTKSQIANNSKTQKAINEIKDHANKRTGSEIGRRFHKNGNVSETPIINNHKLSVGNPNELDGFYHNHTGLGVDIFSPQDISSLIEIARFQDNGNKSNAFVGVIAYGDIHYVIRWGNNDVYSLPTFGTFTQEKLNELTKQQHDDYFNSFGSNQPDLTKEQRLEKVFYQTLDRMGNGIRDNIILQKIDRSNNVSTINLNADGSTSSNPCI